MDRRTTVTAACIASMALMLAGCGSDAGSAVASGSGGAGARVVATTSIWGDLSRQIVECTGAGEVATLIPVGTDPHDYSASSKDVASMVSADLVVANGLGLEGGLVQSIESARSDGATVFEVAPELDPLPFGDDPAAGEDPHVWHDVARAAKASGLIGAELTKATGNPDYAECGTLLQGELMTVNDEVAATLAKVPEDRRILVTDHDALGYLAAAYGYTVAGTVIPGGSTLAEPSSAELAGLAATVRAAGVSAIFANSGQPSKALVDALSAEVGEIAVVDAVRGQPGRAGIRRGHLPGLVRTQRPADLRRAGWLGCARGT